MNTVLDRPDALQVLFHPRRDHGFAYSTPAIRLICVEVEPKVTIVGRLYPAGHQSPLVIFFHGNGEIAADYDDIAQLYHQIGVSFLVWDYRGYGFSSGTPTAGDLLKDAVILCVHSDEICSENGLDPARLYLMGRSLGSAAALEGISRMAEKISGLIIESGFSDTFSLLARLCVHVEEDLEERHGFDNLTKIKQVKIPTLIIHGEADVLIPPQDGRELYEHSGAQDKHLVLIPGAGHNDLMYVGLELYFEAIDNFIHQAY